MAVYQDYITIEMYSDLSFIFSKNYDGACRAFGFLCSEVVSGRIDRDQFQAKFNRMKDDYFSCLCDLDYDRFLSYITGVLDGI